MSVCRPEECQTVHSAQEEQRRLQPAPHLQTQRAFTRNHINARHTHSTATAGAHRANSWEMVYTGWHWCERS